MFNLQNAPKVHFSEIHFFRFLSRFADQSSSFFVIESECPYPKMFVFRKFQLNRGPRTRSEVRQTLRIPRKNLSCLLLLNSNENRSQLN